MINIQQFAMNLLQNNPNVAKKSSGTGDVKGNSKWRFSTWSDDC